MPTPPTRRSPRAAAPPTRTRPLGRGSTAASSTPVRPVAAPFAAVFGVLVAAEDGYLGWLLWDADPGWGWYLLLPALLAGGALIGAVLVLRGRSLGRLSGSAVLALFCLLPLVGLLGLAAFFALLGGGEAVWWALLLLVGPIGGLALALQRPVRHWTRSHRVGRRAGCAR